MNFLISRYNVICLICIFLILIIINCPNTGDPLPQPPPESVNLIADYPYMINDNTYDSILRIYNKSEYTMELDIIYRNPDGTTVSTSSATFNPHQSGEFIKSDFTGSVHIDALCDRYALQTYLEMRRKDGEGAALAQKATLLQRMSVCWFFQLGVNDLGHGNMRSTIITANPWYPGKIFVTITPLTPNLTCNDFFHTEINPLSIHIMKPLDQFANLFPSGISNISFYIQGDTSADDPYSGLTNYTGAHFIESQNGEIGLSNYQYQMNWVNDINEASYKYLVDLHDNDIRNDRIILKSNSSASQTYRQYTLHFYDTSGNEVIGSPCQVSLLNCFDDAESYGIFSPRSLLGNSFTGSIWIDPPFISNYKDNHLQVGIIKENPGQWRDITENSPARNIKTWGGAIPYVTNMDHGWNYRLILFYPETIYKNNPGQDAFNDIFGGPNTQPPEISGGVVVLKFYDYTGTYSGWLAIYMQPNETRYIDVDYIAETYLNGSFRGSIEFLPHIAQQLEVANTNGHAHGSTGNWAANQYY